MNQPTQANRPISISTPLGTDVLLLKSFHLRDALSTIFEIHAELESTNANIVFADILGKQVCITINLPDYQYRYLTGYVARFTQSGFNEHLTCYRAVIVPWLWFLTQSSTARIFQNGSTEPPMPTGGWTVPNIAEFVFNGVSGAYNDELTSSYVALPYCTQFNETDFNFVQRLLECQGIYYYHDSTESACTLVLCDSPTAHEPFPMYEYIPFNPVKNDPRAGERIYDWSMQGRVVPGAVELNDYDYTQPAKALLVEEKDLSGEPYSLREWPYPLNFNGMGETTKAQGADMAEFQAGAIGCRETIYHGASNALGICVGYTFTLQNCPRNDQNIEYLVTREKLSITTPDYATSPTGSTGYEARCLFEAIPFSTQFRPARTARKSVIQGMQTATVVGSQVGNQYVTINALGSVCVQFHWDVDDVNLKGGPLNSGATKQPLTAFVRVSQVSAGKGWGSVFTPHVGDEVVVSFEDGDPDRPIVIGRVYNANHSPPLAESAITQNSIIQDYGGNYFQMCETASKESVTLYSPNNESELLIGPGGVTLSTKGQFTQNASAANWWTDGNYWIGTGGSYGMVTTGAMVMFTVGLNLDAVFGGDVTLRLGPALELSAAAEFKLGYVRSTEIEFGVKYEISYSQEYKFEGGGHNHLFPAGKSLGEQVNIWNTVREKVAEEENTKLAQQTLLANTINTTAATVTTKVAGGLYEVVDAVRSATAEIVYFNGGGTLLQMDETGAEFTTAASVMINGGIVQIN